MKTVFVTLASFKYGIGHFNKCLSLTDKLKNSNINMMPHMSIIDLIFNFGPKSKEYLSYIKKY